MLVPTEAVRQALARFMQSVTIPLLYKGDGNIFSVPTGTLFEVANRHFVITARHIFDNFVPERIAYPERSDRTARRTLGISRLVKPDTKKIDVAVIEILEDITRENLTSGWQFLTLGNVGPAMGGVPFALMGYPSQTAASNPPKGIVYFSDRIFEPPPGAPDLNPEIDLFFEYKRKVLKEGVEEVAAPDLRGTSGGSVWECGYTDDELWMPAKILKVVGVQSAQMTGNYFRAVSWGAVASIFGQMDDDLKVAIQKVLVPESVTQQVQAHQPSPNPIIFSTAAPSTP